MPVTVLRLQRLLAIPCTATLAIRAGWVGLFLKIGFSYLFIRLFICVQVRVTVWVQGSQDKLTRVNSLLLQAGARNGTQVVTLGSKCLAHRALSPARCTGF